MHTIKIGTRGSRLALVQAESIRDELRSRHPDRTFELTIIKTTGDKILDAPLSKIGDKGLFTKEIEAELIAGTIDLAVHSMKDMPTSLPEGLTVGAVTKRLDERDVFIAKGNKKFSGLTAGDIIATSSLRRRSQVLARVPGITIVDIRGNVQTRLRKMHESDGMCGIILAYAGIDRLGMHEIISDIIPVEHIIPAVGQAALAIEIRSDDAATVSIIKPLHDEITAQAIFCERSFMAALEGGCQVPIAGNACITGNSLTMTGLIASLDGREMFRDTISGDPKDFSSLGEKLAQKLLDMGGKKILDEIYGRFIS